MEFSKIEKCLLLYKINKSKLFKKYKSKEPKISIISPIYNSEKYILRFLKNMQSQNFVSIEIILVDDYSIDNSVKIIEKYKKKDERIILIKNKNHKGTFVNRNLGVLFSKGKYIILPDPDDNISKNILNSCYKIAEKYNLEIIRFNIYVSSEKKLFLHSILNKLENRHIIQPQLSTYIYYGINELRIIDIYIHNKFYKKEVFIKALNSLTKDYFKMYNKYSEDSLMNYIIYRNSKNYFFLKKIGYYYIKHFDSITKSLFKKTELRIISVFIFVNIVYEYSKYTKYEKDMSNLLFSNYIQFLHIEKILPKIKTEKIITYIDNSIKRYLQSKFFNNENKYILRNFKKIIKKN